MANLFDFLSRITQVIKPLVYVLSLLVFRPAIAQTGKDDPDPTRWIVYTQTYYKISVTEDGLYRLTKADLQQAGLAVDQLDPTTIQLFHRGIEQAIFVAGETDKRFDTNDFIEFYGRKNDGAQDSLLYRIDESSQRRVQPHAYYSLFSDTSAYFLTWRLDGKPGKRMAAYTDTAYSHLTAEPYHWEEELRIFTDTYPAGTIYPLGASYENGAILTNYDTGEGWTGPLIKATDRYDQTFSLTKFKSVSDQNGNPIKPILSYLLVGRNAGVHRVSCLAGSSTTTLRALGQASFGDYETAQFEADWRVTDLDPSGNLTVSIQPQETGEEVSVSYVRIQYPQRTDLAGMEQKVLRLRPNTEGRSFLDLTSAPSGTRLFDISDLNNPVRVQGNWVNDHWQGVIQNAQTSRLLLATSQPKTVLSLKPVSFRQIDPSKPNFLIITHPLLRKPTATEADPVRAYATYRASDAGGQYDTLTLNIDQLFDQFSYGERHPLAIRRFADYMLRGSSRPQFLFLIGQSRDPQSVRKLPDTSLLDLIPNAGWPGSDIGLIEGLNGESANVPAMPIGRLNTASPQNVLDYLNKVKEHENTAQPALWRKNVLHLSGGRNRYELLEFRSFVDEFKSVIEAPFAGGRVTTLSKQTDNLVETIPVSEIINQGVGLITLFGHSSLDVADIDIGFVSNDILGYRNKGRYPFLLVNGCAAGNTFFGRPTFGTDWVLTPNRGAILFLAHTYNGFATPLKSYSDKLYEVLSDSQFVAQSIGLVQQETIRRYLKTNNSIFDITTAQQMTLQGDPAVRVFPYSSPDFAFATGSLHLRNSQGDSLTTQSDSVRISVVIVNYGRVTASPIAVRIRQYEANGHLLNERFFTEKSPFYADTLSWLIPNRHATTLPSYFELVLDPENQIAERNELNNSVEISTDGSANGLPFSIDSTPPLLEVAFDGKRIADGDFVSARPVIDVLVQDENRRLLRTDTTGVDLYLQHPCSAGGCPYERLMFSGSETHWATADSTNAFRLSYQPGKPLAAGLYTFVATGSDLSGNRAAPYRIHFSVKNQGELIGAGAYPNPFTNQIRFVVSVTGATAPTDLTVRISDLAGRSIRTLHGSPRVGLNEWFWNGTSDDGAKLPNGIYFYQIDGGDLPTPGSVHLTGRIILNR